MTYNKRTNPVLGAMATLMAILRQPTRSRVAMLQATTPAGDVLEHAHAGRWHFSGDGPFLTAAVSMAPAFSQDMHTLKQASGISRRR